MIVDFLLSMVETVLVWVAGLLPSWEFGAFFDRWPTVLSYMGDMDYFLPIHEAFAVVVAVFMLFPALMGVSLAVWIIALIRGGSARG